MINKKEGLRRKYAGAYATKWIYFISAIILFLVLNYANYPYGSGSFWHYFAYISFLIFSIILAISTIFNAYYRKRLFPNKKNINYKILILVFFSLLVLLTLFAWLNWSKININYLEIAAFIFYFSSLLTFGLDEIHQSIKQILQYLKSKKQKT
ncbi:MAG TPA: hypothetical protein VJH65_03675 [Candidatus Nanoarchaeia archaeon]|nr:hypothetical protein [Candidatus Nanoarchaeia archaeon]